MVWYELVWLQNGKVQTGVVTNGDEMVWYERVWLQSGMVQTGVVRNGGEMVWCEQVWLQTGMVQTGVVTNGDEMVFGTNGLITKQLHTLLSLRCVSRPSFCSLILGGSDSP